MASNFFDDRRIDEYIEQEKRGLIYVRKKSRYTYNGNYWVYYTSSDIDTMPVRRKKPQEEKPNILELQKEDFTL